MLLLLPCDLLYKCVWRFCALSVFKMCILCPFKLRNHLVVRDATSCILALVFCVQKSFFKVL